MSLAIPTAVEEKALRLLGDGVSQEMVATALGISVSRISQLMSDDSFKNAVLELRYKNLAEHTERDRKIDAVEDKLLDKLEKNIGMLFEPMKIAAVWSKVNAARRRGQSAPETVQTSQPVHAIVLPAVLIQNFTTNINNQIVAAGDREMITIQSGKMNSLIPATGKEISDVVPTNERAIKSA